MPVKSLKNNYLVHLYFLLWCLYYFQGVLYERGSIISRGILVLVLLVSSIHFVRSHVLGIPRTLKWIDCFVLMITVYGFIGFTKGYVSNVSGMTVMDYIKGVLVSFLPVYSFYYYSKRGKISESHLFIWTIVLLVVYSMTFIFRRTEGGGVIHVVNDIEEGTNNAGYLMVSLIPLLFFFGKKPVIQYTVLAIVVFFVVTSVKRGAMIVGLVMSVILILNSLRDSKTWQKILAFFLFAAVVYLSYRYVLYLISSSDFVNLRIEQTLSGDSSNRDEIYSYFLNYFLNQSNVGSFLFGSGAFATARIYDYFAHNDWLELAINQGVLGLIVYLMFWVSLTKDWRKCKAERNVYFALGLTFLFLLFRTFVSMSYSMVPLSCSLILGYGLAVSSNNYSK